MATTPSPLPGTSPAVRHQFLQPLRVVHDQATTIRNCPAQPDWDGLTFETLASARRPGMVAECPALLRRRVEALRVSPLPSFESLAPFDLQAGDGHCLEHATHDPMQGETPLAGGPFLCAQLEKPEPLSAGAGGSDRAQKGAGSPRPPAAERGAAAPGRGPRPQGAVGLGQGRRGLSLRAENARPRGFTSCPCAKRGCAWKSRRSGPLMSRSRSIKAWKTRRNSSAGTGGWSGRKRNSRKPGGRGRWSAESSGVSRRRRSNSSAGSAPCPLASSHPAGASPAPAALPLRQALTSQSCHQCLAETILTSSSPSVRRPCASPRSQPARRRGGRRDAIR